MPRPSPPFRRAARRLAAVALAACAPLLLLGCGSGGSDAGRPNQAATLLLDFQPNAVHAGIYLATARDYSGAEGVHLEVQVPGTGTDAARLLLSGRAQFAVLDIHDLAIARAKGRDLVGVMAIVQRPLAAVIAQPDVRRPRALEGRRVGVTGLPSDDAVLDSLVRGDGGDPRKVRRTAIGFGAVPAILGRKVSGATAFWNAEGVALKAKRPEVRIFKVDEFGAPAYPELILTTTRTLVQDQPALVRATVTALQRGYREAIVDPESAVTALVDAVPGTDRALTAAQLDAVQSSFQAPNGRVGTLDLDALRRWAAWERRFGIVAEAPEVALMFAPRFAAEGAGKATQNSG
ncbi:MAG: transporter substrate-binding protein [Solirubrobacterales bacterium]|nr:transporter substrate-binding protein [Solirubrobacterales bacterium]